MRVLDQLEPKRVFSFFEDLCAIPHGSGNIIHNNTNRTT